MLDGLATLALGQLIGLGILRDGGLPDKGIALTFAIGVVIAGLSLDPGTHVQGGAALETPIARSAVAGTVAALLVVANVGWRVRPGTVLGLAVGVTVLLLAARGATYVLGGVLGSPARGRLGVAAVMALAGAAPLWLGPALERLGAREGAVDAVVAASPLTYLAAMCGYDYLRQDWFYAHSTVASLRFAYPTPAISTVVYLAIALALLSGDRRLSTRWRTRE